jgi:hypothetical protein
MGRETKLKDLHQKIFSGENFLLLVNGKGGMGKPLSPPATIIAIKKSILTSLGY